jgi:hypothetical protein
MYGDVHLREKHQSEKQYNQLYNVLKIFKQCIFFSNGFGIMCQFLYFIFQC